MSSDPVEINELTVMINQDIKGLNKQIAALQEVNKPGFSFFFLNFPSFDDVSINNVLSMKIIQ